MDHKHAAQQVLDCIGGKENIVSAAHCATRLRLVIADNSRVCKNELENAEGAKGVFEAQGQLQIIFGTGTVNKVYDEFLQLAGIEGGTKEEVRQAAAAKAPWYQRAIKTLSDIFVPIIPAIVASGFLMGITEPSIFGVNLRCFKPFLGGLAGGACGAWYASIVGLGATGTGVTGIFGILLHLHMPLQYIIMMAISFGVSFAVTWIIWKPEEVKA